MQVTPHPYQTKQLFCLGSTDSLFWITEDHLDQ